MHTALHRAYQIVSQKGRRAGKKLAPLRFATFNRFCRQSCKSGIHPVSPPSVQERIC